MRIPITRHDEDGTIIDGTAESDVQVVGGTAVYGTIHDFCDLDGEPLVLPPGSTFEVVLPLG